MATLTVFQFEREDGAQEAMDMIEKLQKQALIHVQDAAIITRRVGSRKPKTKHLSQLAGVGTLDGAFWGTLFGLIFFAPFLHGDRDRRGALDKVVFAARSLPKFELITFNLSNEQEAALRVAFANEEASVRV